MIGRRFLSLIVAASCFVLPSCTFPEGNVTIQGAGATFPAPLYKRWFLEFYKLNPNIRVNYQGIGSGAGIRQFTEGLTAFGASDAAMSQAEVDQFKNERGSDVQLVPMTAGSVVICYNLPGISDEVKLTRKTYLRIFLGEITNWNDKSIAESNPKLQLPNLDITVVRRADGSGTTYAFTNHLDAVGKNVGIPWTPGFGKSVVWPKKDMIGGRGNPGVAAQILQIPGAIGYLETGYAELGEIPMAILENKSGNFVAVTIESGRAALAHAKIPDDFRIWVPDTDAPDGYPIVTYTWLLCYKDYTKFRGDPNTGAALQKVIRFCLTDGQEFSKELHYIPLPKNVVDPVLAAVNAIKIGSEK